MAKPIDSKVLFITTSPRTPEKMVPEIELLDKNFNGEVWNKDTQTAFMKILKEESFFDGEGKNDPAFSARDRINRAPKSLGFVILSPKLSLTDAGVELIKAKRKDDIFLRQMLKFQLPSPYHKLSDKAALFFVKPYLEIFRLVRHFGSLAFDELMIFGLQIIDFRIFDQVVDKIEDFRVGKIENKGKYKNYKKERFEEELGKIYEDELFGLTEASAKTLITKKGNNMRDYADACVRYLRATGMVNVSYQGKSLSIVQEKKEEVDFFLRNTEREPCFINDEASYVSYLGNPNYPKLFVDDLDRIKKKLRVDFKKTNKVDALSLPELKEELENEIISRKENILKSQISDIKNFKLYEDIQEVFEKIENDRTLSDAPLMLEWNTWRAMTMLDGGEIKANLKFDDFGSPMSTAIGNMPDIVCEYDDFQLSVEVTMASGQKQYEMEGEPVSRHLGKLKKSSEKPVYCLFIAPKINPSSVAHFFMSHKVDIEYYGGKSLIIPLELSVFRKMIEDTFKASYIPKSDNVHKLFKNFASIADEASNEKVWYEGVKRTAMNWLSLN